MGPTDYHGLTLTYFISRSRLLPSAYNWEIFEKLFLKFDEFKECRS